MSQKKFIKYTNFNDNTTPNHRDSKRPSKKNYFEKPYKGQAIKPLINAFVTLPPSQKIQQLIATQPKFFNQISKNPQKQRNQNLNQFLILINVKKAQQQRAIQNQSDGQLNWDTGSEEDFKLQSKPINEDVISKVSGKLTTVTCKKNDQLKKHQKQFLDDYYRTKRKNNQQEQKQIINTKQATKPQKKQQQPQKSVKTNTSFESWLNFGVKSQSGCWIQKIQQNDTQNNDLQVGEDDGMFKESDNQKSFSTSSDQDDAFVDEKPNTTTVQSTYNKNKQSLTNQINQSNQGVVYINSYLFTNIAEKLGISPLSCQWMITDNKSKYRVSTQYMDQIYRQQKIAQYYPFVSLDGSEFLRNEDITLQNYEKFKRRQYRNEKPSKKYKESQKKYEKVEKKQYKLSKKQ